MSNFGLVRNRIPFITFGFDGRKLVMPVSSLDLSVFSADSEVREDEEAVRVIGTLFPDFSTEEAEICWQVS